MKLKRMFTTIDTHTGGDTTRTVTGGLPYIKGKTVNEKRNFLQNHSDWIRKVLMTEPRGNNIQSGAIITEPCREEADVGVIFIDAKGYPQDGDQNIIGIATALIESGLIEGEEPYTSIGIETPSEVIKVSVKVEKGTAKEVTIKDSSALVYEENVEIEIPGIGFVKVDIAFSGVFYAQVEAEEIKAKNNDYNKMKEIAKKILNELNVKVKPNHSELNFPDDIEYILIRGLDKKTQNSEKTLCILPDGFFSRSSKVTATNALVALLYSRGKLKKDEIFNNKNYITDTTIRGRVIKEAKVGKYNVIATEITGRAFVTGMHTFILDPEDSFQEGFII